jgi:hypothetical protein
MMPVAITTTRGRGEWGALRDRLGGVDDYFASFDKNHENDDEDESSSSPSSSSASKGWGPFDVNHYLRSLGRKVAKDEREVGPFDVNRYLRSLGNNFSGDGDDENGETSSSPSLSSSSKGWGPFDVNHYLRSLGNAFAADGDDPRKEQRERREHPSPPPTPTSRKDMTYEEFIAYDNARLCPKLLLTQCAIQTYVNLLERYRDPHSVKWFEDFLGTRNLGDYHGTSAINVTRYRTWDTVLYDMMNQPNTRVIVSARGRGGGRRSDDDPNSEKRKIDEYGIDIRPASLVRRLLAVREQLASEFERDLEIVRMVDVTTVMTLYYRKIAAAVSKDEDGATTMKDGDTSQSSSLNRVSFDIVKEFMRCQDAGSSDGSSSSSLLRRANFDLLYALCTQASAHKLLWELERSASTSSSTNDDDVDDNVITFEWFKQFYVDNSPIYFDGNQNFDRSDDFIDALLRAPPPLEDGWHSADPLRLAQRIIAMQKDIALEWMGMMEEVAEDHRDINKALFCIMMGRSMEDGSSDDDDVDTSDETTFFDEWADGTGAFD